MAFITAREHTQQDYSTLVYARTTKHATCHYIFMVIYLNNTKKKNENKKRKKH